ncbi:MAG TPA: DUF429 domain-containing protein [Nitrospirota bacterium]
MTKAGGRKRTSIVVGIDLAGSPLRNTGICTLRGMTITSIDTLHTDQEILDYIKRIQPDLIAVDAPLTLPPGRTSLEERNAEHFRPSDRDLMKRGIRFFPITLGPMRMLTARGIGLKKKLVRRGYAVIEIYPGAAQDIFGMGRKQHGLLKLLRGLKRQGLKGLKREMNGDELDAATGALVGRMYLKGQAEVLGDLTTGAIVVPKQMR